MAGRAQGAAAKEKKFTKARDELSQQRRELPWVKVDKPYAFEGPDGKQPLADLFDDRGQLIVYHFVFGPDWEAGYPHCSRWADNFNGIIVHLNQRDVTMVAISRAPYAKLAAYRKRMGWTFKWLSSLESDFNIDFNVSFTPQDIAAKTRCIISSARIPSPPSVKASACSSRTPPAPCSTPIRPMRAASTC